MLNIGDKVKFLNAVGGGRVVGFQSKKVAVVENQDGFEIPVLITELVKVEDVASQNKTINRDFSKKPEPKPAPVAPKPEPEARKPLRIEGNDEPKFFMAFYPTDQKNPVGGEIEAYLINDSNFTLLYQFCHFDGNVYKTVDYGELEPNTKTLLESVSQTDLANLPRYLFRIIAIAQNSNKLVSPVEKEVAVNAVKFYKEKSFTRNNFFSGKAMVFDLVPNPMLNVLDNLTDADFKQVVESKDKENRPEISEKKKIVVPEVLEVDLHIEQLVEKTAGLSNHEILQFQMDQFHSVLKTAIANPKIKRVVFIHGVGNGVLKQEIHKKLKSTYAKYYFQDASFQEYGYGATMVILRR